MSTLVYLPYEVVTLIVAELETDDFLNLRMTCKELNAKSFSHFLSCYFNIRRHMLNGHSLHNLLEVSSHPQFGSALRTLEVCVHHLTEDPPLYHPGEWDRPGHCENEVGNRVEAVVDEVAYRGCFDDQRRLRERGLDIAYLTRALVKLPNCKQIYISDTNSPWGASSQKRQTGVPPISSMARSESVEHVKHTVRVVLTSIMASQVSLRLNISPGFNRLAMTPEMLPVWSDIALKPSLSKLTLITSLALLIDTKTHSPPDAWTEDLLNFIGLFPALSEFSIDFYDRDERRRLGKFLSSLRLQCLVKLAIACANCTENDLLTLFLNHKQTLREIHLDCVGIIEGEGSWISLERAVERRLTVEKFCHLD